MTRRRILFVLAVILFLLIGTVSWAVYLSFAVVKPTTEQINNNLKKADFAKILIIPEGIPRPSQDFNETRYLWEMETNAGEVTAMQFNYFPAFSRNDKEIIATLQVSENGDPSIFVKVLPAIISDQQSLTAAEDPQKANLSTNSQAGYESISLEVDPKNNKTTKIIWKLPKNNLSRETKDLYKKLNYPNSLLKIYYALPNFLLSLARG